MSTKRKQISKKLRFEVFKRDSFTCQYCGRKAPDVILECDHIVPVADGGPTTMMNLVTSCMDCNRGKGKRRLSDLQMASAQRTQMDKMAAIKEQTKMLIEWKKELEHVRDLQLDAISDLIFHITEWTVSNIGRVHFSRLISRFGFEEVFSSTRISFEKYFDGSESSWDRAYEKVGGICYNRKYRAVPAREE